MIVDRILSTIIQPSAGKAFVSGFDVREEPFKVREQIGVLPHNSGIYNRLNAVENIEYYGELHGIKPDTLKERVENLLEQLQMKDFCLRSKAEVLHLKLLEQVFYSFLQRVRFDSMQFTIILDVFYCIQTVVDT